MMLCQMMTGVVPKDLYRGNISTDQVQSEQKKVFCFKNCRWKLRISSQQRDAIGHPCFNTAFPATNVQHSINQACSSLFSVC